MNPHPAPPSSVLSRLLHLGGEFARALLQMLTPSDILILMLVDSNIYHTVKITPGWINRLFYSKRLQIERSIYFDFQVECVEAQPHLRQVLDRIATDSLDFKIEVETLRLLEKQMAWNLNLYLDQAETSQNIEDLRVILVEPELPMPQLQRQNVGEFCNSPIQSLMLSQNLGNLDEIFQVEVSPLRKSILESADQILSFFADPGNCEFLKHLRYNPEVDWEFTPTSVPLINLIQNLILTFNVYISSMAKFLAACGESWDQGRMFSEFMLRYSVFRNSIVTLEDKFGFLFKHFQEAFRGQFEDYPTMPPFSLWRVVLKLWVQRMAKYHEQFHNCFGQLVLLEMEETVKQTIEVYVSNPESYNNSSTECQYLQLSFLLSRSQLTLLPKQQRRCLVAAYQQYLVDISANAFNIQWCGSTNQRLLGPYFDAESAFLCLSSNYCQKVVESFSNPLISRKILVQTLDALSLQLKPTTYLKVQNQINDLLDTLKDRALDSNNLAFKDVVTNWKKHRLNTSKTDAKIRFIAEENQCPQETGEKFEMYLALWSRISMEQLEQDVQRMKGEILVSDKESSLAEEQMAEKIKMLQRANTIN